MNTNTTETEIKTKKAYPKRGPYHLRLNGLHACLRSDKSAGNIKAMLVSHAFVDLWNLIKDDHSFELRLFNSLDEQERDYMRYCLNRCKIESREFDSAFNLTITHLVDRLKMLQGAVAIGDDNSTIPGEMRSLIDKLFEKGVFTSAYHAQLKRALRSS